MNTGDTVLVIGSAGQIGTDLVTQLRENLGGSRVVASDVKDQQGFLRETGPFHVMDVLDIKAVAEVIRIHTDDRDPSATQAGEVDRPRQ